jgi:DNA ligase (NAD+)
VIKTKRTSAGATTDRIVELQNLLDHADAIYYAIGGAGDTGISDERYDFLKREYAQLNPMDTDRLERVGPPRLTETAFKKTKHAEMVGSIENCLNPEEFAAWWSGHSEPLIASPKLDGLTLVLTYVGGNLKSAVTRGNHLVGDNVTANAMRIKGIPTRLTQSIDFTARGEVVLTRQAFDALNQPDPVTREKPFRNARNAAAGIIGRKNGKDCEQLRFIAHGCSDLPAMNSEPDRFQQLICCGFEVVQTEFCENLDRAMCFYQDLLAGRETRDIALDGVVFTISPLAEQRRLGIAGKRPRYQRALKFPSIDVETTLEGLDWQIGDGGALTPVGRITPVEINGATVSSVTLHNLDKIRGADLAIGDRITVTRSGDVIPYFLNKISSGENRTPINPPECCPICRTEVAFRKNVDGADGVILACENMSCPGLQKGMVMRWIKSLDILSVGPEVMTALFDSGLVKVIPDLYTLDLGVLGDMLVNGRCFGEKRAVSLKNEINKTRTLTIDQFLGSLSVHGLGKGRVELIRQKWQAHFANNPQSQKAVCDPLTWLTTAKGNSAMKLLAAVLGIPNTAAKFQVQLDHRKGLISKLLTLITIEVLMPKQVVSNGNLAMQSFCFTTCRMTAEESVKLAALGGVEKSGVAKGLSYLVQRDASKTTGKSTKAATLGIPVISYERFQQMLNM